MIASSTSFVISAVATGFSAAVRRRTPAAGTSRSTSALDPVVMTADMRNMSIESASEGATVTNSDGGPQ